MAKGNKKRILEIDGSSSTSSSNGGARLKSSSQVDPLEFSDNPLAVNPVDPLSTSPPLLIKGIPEFPAVSASTSLARFAVLVGIKAPSLKDNNRAPIDLVTVLDVSNSMAGPKLALLKKAVCFVIDNLGPSDRLSIVSFNSRAQRILPLCLMTDRGREDAAKAVNSLSASDGTNIVEGLKKGVRVLDERRQQNPVSSILLLSDGHDSRGNFKPKYQIQKLLPPSICSRNSEQATIPVHTFGFGKKHDATTLHAISNESGGTFSFIESLDKVQEAFARCIGGLLSVVAQGIQIKVRPISAGVHIGSIASLRYLNEISNQGEGIIHAGDIYAAEEKFFLVFVSVPLSSGAEMTPLLDLTCLYKDSVSNDIRQISGERVEIWRPLVLSRRDTVPSLEVDRQKNRLLVAEGIEEAQRLADTGNLDGALSVLAEKMSALMSSASAQAGDSLCASLEAELREITDRMASLNLYEQSGKAYILSSMSSHSNQRATTRGDSKALVLVEGGPIATGGAVIRYDTPNMLDMVKKSLASAK